MLEPNPEAPWPTGLSIREQLIQLPGEDKSKISVTVENSTDQDLTLCGCTTLGWLHSVDAVYPLELKAVEGLESQPSISNAETKVEKPHQIPEKEPWDPPVDLSHNK